MFSKSCESCCGLVKARACCASLSLPCFHIRADKALLNPAQETANQNNGEVTDSLVIFQFQSLCFCEADWWTWWWDWGNGLTGVCWRRRRGPTPSWSAFEARSSDWPPAASATHSQMRQTATPKGSSGTYTRWTNTMHFEVKHSLIIILL